jgi:hypothetical protein
MEYKVKRGADVPGCQTTYDVVPLDYDTADDLCTCYGPDAKESAQKIARAVNGFDAMKTALERALLLVDQFGLDTANGVTFAGMDEGEEKGLALTNDLIDQLHRAIRAAEVIPPIGDTGIRG